MKRFLAYLSVAAALTACNLYGEPEVSTSPLEAEGIDIAVTAVKDSSFTVTLTPKGEAAYYSYLVDNSQEAENLDASKVYSVSYKSVMQGTVCYAKNPTYTFTVNAEPNTAYVVYAVSSSKEGNVGELAYVKTATSDSVVPEIVKSAANGRSFEFTFSENVNFVDGKSVTAKYYASNFMAKEHLAYVDDSQKMGVTKAEDTQVEVNGNVATVTFPTLPDGAYYAIVMENGAFADSANLPCAGFETVFKYNEETGKISVNLPYHGKIDAASMELNGELPQVIVDHNEYITLETSEYISGAVAKMVQIKRTYTDAEGKKITEESVLSGAPYYGALGTNKFGVKLAEEPGRGDYITITIPEKTVYDVYGNYNEAVTIGPLLYSYNFSLEDVCGEYTFNSESGYGYGKYSNVIEIKESDNAEAGNIMFVGELTDVEIKAYAYFDKDLGYIELEPLPVVGKVKDFVYGSDGKPVEGDDGNPIIEEYDLALCLTTNGNNIYNNPLGFDMTVAHQLDFWFTGKAFLGLLEAKGESYVGYYDVISFTSIEYGAAQGSKSVPFNAQIAPKGTKLSASPVRF